MHRAPSGPGSGHATRAVAIFISLVGAIAARAEPYVENLDGQLVLHVEGSPRAMGRQHGTLLRPRVRRVIRELIHEDLGAYPESLERLLKGAAVMERYLPRDYRDELRGLAEAAGVDYMELVLAQLFGDVERGQYCTAYAAYGPATKSGECIVGRNMDYWYSDISRHSGCIIHFTPRDGYPFMTVSWAGIINGWTAMNVRGVIAANNTAFGARENSLHGLSTCFMIRKIAQYAGDVDEGVRIIERTPRAVGTNMIVAGGNPPKAAMVEYDHAEVVVRWAQRGYVLAANDYRELYQQGPGWADTGGDILEAATATGDSGDDLGYYGRYEILERLIKQNYGRIDRRMNFAAHPGVYMSINLHCALLFPRDLSFRLAQGRAPAAEGRFRTFRMDDKGVYLLWDDEVTGE
ncbi:MAG: C45 family autoproteolytic acyltransferase/hydrolase [Armatimonadota bacterium]